MDAPKNERETIFLFDQLADVLGWHLLYSGSPFPDAIIGNGQGENLRAEFEYRARNFRDHGHDPAECDLIVCWINDWPDAPLPVWGLGETLARLGMADPESVNPGSAAMARVDIRLDDQADKDIIDWLAGQPNKTDAIKMACRLSMTSTARGGAGDQVGSPSAGPAGGNCQAHTANALRASQSAFAELDLSDGSLAAIRAVVDAALDEKLPEHLAGVALGIEQSPAVTARGGAGDADPELAAKLDAMF